VAAAAMHLKLSQDLFWCTSSSIATIAIYCYHCYLLLPLLSIATIAFCVISAYQRY